MLRMGYQALRGWNWLNLVSIYLSRTHAFVTVVRASQLTGVIAPWNLLVRRTMTKNVPKSDERVDDLVSLMRWRRPTVLDAGEVKAGGGLAGAVEILMRVQTFQYEMRSDGAVKDGRCVGERCLMLSK